jgi:hypothetical protein
LRCNRPDLIRSSGSTSSCASRVVQLQTLSCDGFRCDTAFRLRPQLENDSILTFSVGSVGAARKRADSISWSFTLHRRQVRKSPMRDRGQRRRLVPTRPRNSSARRLSIADTSNPLFASETAFARLLLVFRRLHDQGAGGNPMGRRE